MQMCFKVEAEVCPFFLLKCFVLFESVCPNNRRQEKFMKCICPLLDFESDAENTL